MAPTGTPERLCKSKSEQVNARLPAVLNDKLDHLCRLAEDAGAGKVSRQEILGMLLYECDDEPEALANRVVAYRRVPA